MKKQKQLCVDLFCPDAVHHIMTVLKRMGWQWGNPNEHGYMPVEIPVEDEALFHFLENSFS